MKTTSTQYINVRHNGKWKCFLGFHDEYIDKTDDFYMGFLVSGPGEHYRCARCGKDLGWWKTETKK